MQGLGLEYAKQLVRAGARILVLASRNPELPLQTLIGLASKGVIIFTARVDAADSAAVSVLLEWVHENLPHLGQVAHAAGVSGFHMLPDMADDDLWHVAQPKVCSSPPTRAWSCLGAGTFFY